ncbi:MAG: molybdenum cofactor guanylyltransferase [Desulfovibrio sp.]|nr:molybdenum cofactor guanylyltransferase [Desulfovibrio sp.]
MRSERVSPSFQNVLGALLAGGLSSRMGRNKALLPTPEGPSFADRSWALLDGLLEHRVFVVRDSGSVGNHPCIRDACARSGPLGGLWTALRFARFHGLSFVLLLACDMPNMTASFLRRLLAEPWKEGILSITPRSPDGWEQGLAALYHVAALPFLAEALDQSRLSLRYAIPSVHKAFLPFAEEDASLFFNVNTPEEYSAFLSSQSRMYPTNSLIKGRN